MNFQCGINTRIVGKCDPEKLSYAGAWENASKTFQELSDHIALGHPWMPALLSGNRKRWQSNANYAEVLAIDVDNGYKRDGQEVYEEKLTISQALDHPFVEAFCGLGIESSSSQEGWNKFRLVFRLPKPLENWQHIRICNQYLVEQIDAADPKCKDASRYFFGGEGRSPFILRNDAVLPDSFVEDALNWYSDIERAEKERVLAARRHWDEWKRINGVEDADTVLMDALNTIDPNCDYNHWIAIGMALAGMGDQWLTVWDAWSSQGVDYRPDEVQSKWKSFRGKRPAPEVVFGIAKKYGFKFPRGKVVDISGVGRSMPKLKDLPPPPEKTPEMTLDQEFDMDLDYYNRVIESGNSRAIALHRRTLEEKYRQYGRIDELALDLRREKEADLTPVSEVLANTFREIEDRAENNIVPGISCGFYDLDSMTQGFQRSDLIIVAARPAAGKTAFCVNIARNIAAYHNLPTAIFSLEMSKEQLAYRLLSAEAQIESGRMRAGRLTMNEWEPLGHAISGLSQMPIYLDDTPSITTDSIRGKLYRLKAEAGDIGLVCIDYLQLMRGHGGENRVQELSNISRDLKSIAREINTPIIALSQLSRGVEARADKRPVMSDIRESGAIEQDADLIMMLYRDEYYNPETPDRGVAEVIIAKHRNGPVGTVKLLFEPQFTKFRNMTERSLAA